jgi:chemotaxis-related protein WspD
MSSDTRPVVIDDCWNRIGVHGDRTCERLQEHGHCRNCDVHAGAAARLMQRSVPVGYREDWTRHFAEPEPQEHPADEAALVFRIGREWLALPARHAVSVAENGKPHRLPHRKGGVLHGIVNVKGRLYPCMSLPALLQVDPHDAPANGTGRHIHARIVLAQLGESMFALPVQEVVGIHRYRDDDLQAPPATLSAEARRYMRGVLRIGGMTAACLDAELLGRTLAEALK